MADRAGRPRWLAAAVAAPGAAALFSFVTSWAVATAPHAVSAQPALVVRPAARPAAPAEPNIRSQWSELTEGIRRVDRLSVELAQLQAQLAAARRATAREGESGSGPGYVPAQPAGTPLLPGFAQAAPPAAAAAPVAAPAAPPPPPVQATTGASGVRH